MPADEREIATALVPLHVLGRSGCRKPSALESDRIDLWPAAWGQMVWVWVVLPVRVDVLADCEYVEMAGGLSELNRALNRIPKRAEQRHADQLRATFVDSGVSALLETSDHQVLYGRRGTGKTHAMRYLEGHVNSAGGVAVYVDLRTVGSPDGLFGGSTAPPTERAAKLLVDLLGQVHEALITAAVEDDELIADTAFVSKLDALATAITTVRIAGDIEVEQQGEQTESRSTSSQTSVTLSRSPSIGLSGESVGNRATREVQREVRRGTEAIRLNFSEVARALRDLAAALGGRRLWILLDEWSSLPQKCNHSSASSSCGAYYPSSN